MKNTSVVYFTKTKHSKKLAEAVAQSLGVTAHSVTDRPSVSGAELLFIVGGIYGGESMPELLEYVSGLSPQQVKSAALITSCASGRHGQKSVRSQLECSGIPVLDEYICLGSLLFLRAGHPNKAELQAAAEFAARLASQTG